MEKAPRAKLLYLHYGLTLLIMFGFGFLPAIDPITPYGMRVVGIFIGAVYGWTFTDMLIPSILGILAMGLLEVLPIAQIAAGGFGSPVVWFTILLILLTNVLEELGITEYIALWAMSRKYLNGHPWILSCTFLIVAYFLGAVNPIAAMFVLWGILYQICQKTHIAPYHPYPTIIIIGTTLFAILGMVLAPFQMNPLLILSTFQAITQLSINFGQYAAFMLPVMFLMILGYVGVMRFLLRIDVRPLQNMAELTGQAQPALNRSQKFGLFFLLSAIVLLLAPSLLPASWLLVQVLNTLGLFGTGCLIIVCMLMLQVDGKPLMNFEKMMAHGLPWGAIFLMGLVLPLSGIITSDQTGINQLFANLLAPLTSFPNYLFVALLLLIAALLTNVANNISIALIILPILCSFAAAQGLNSSAVVVLLIIATHLAILTPAACPFAGLMFGNTNWLRPIDVLKYAPIFILMCFLVLITFGWFWANLIF